MANPILPRAPLILAIAEVNFSPILSIAKKIASIQEQLRQVGFPEYGVGNEDTDLELSQNEPRLRWEFCSKNHRTAIIISHDTFTLETSEYSEFGDFVNDFERMLRLFAEITQPNLLKNINLRYVDLIQSLDGKKSDDLIRSQFIQLAHVPIIQNHYQYESVEFQTAVGIVRVNLIRSFDDAVVPPDIEPAVEIHAKKTNEDIILDMNHIAIFEEVDFSIAKIIDTFQQIHDQDVRPTFESIVTPLAIQLWGKEAL